MERMNTMHITVTADNFDKEVLQSEKPVLLDFWAEWCGPCQMLAPIIDEIAEARSDIVVGKVNVDEEAELSLRFGIRSIPTLVVMKNGEKVASSIGYQSREEIEKLL